MVRPFPYPTGEAFPLILAPMAGVSEPPFRRISRRMGADVVLTEFLNSEGIRRRIGRVLEGCEFDEVERPIGIQIYGSDAEAMAEATRLVTEHYAPDFIDINFGCPVKKVVNGHAARAFTLHARTRSQMFTGNANWDEIAAVVEALDVPVIGNGDITTADDVIRMRDHTGCAGVMVGRGSFGNPWLFRDARALLAGRERPASPDAAERFAVALEHANLALALQGDNRRTVMEFRKHFGCTPAACATPRRSGSGCSRLSRWPRPSRSSPTICRRHRSVRRREPRRVAPRRR